MTSLHTTVYVYDYLENGTYVDKGLNFTIKSNPYKN